MVISGTQQELFYVTLVCEPFLVVGTSVSKDLYGAHFSSDLTEEQNPSPESGLKAGFSNRWDELF